MVRTAAATAAVPHTPDTRPVHDSASRIVVCDDTAVSRVGTATALERAGFVVVESTTAAELRARTSDDDEPVACVVLDLYLDGPRGRPSTDLIAEVRDRGPRVVVYSTWALDPDIHRALAAGASAFLQKGAELDPLVDVVRRVVALDGDRDPLLTPEVAAAIRRRELFGLTDAEVAVLELVADHLTTSEIAAVRYVTEDTIKTQVNSVRAKLGAATRAEAVRTARQHGLLGRWSPS